jgi:hypothetical protein
MQVVLTTPANLVGQDASKLLDAGLAGSARGAGPSGPLGASITLSISYLNMCLAWGFSISSYIYG